MSTNCLDSRMGKAGNVVLANASKRATLQCVLRAFARSRTGAHLRLPALRACPAFHYFSHSFQQPGSYFHTGVARTLGTKRYFNIPSDAVPHSMLFSLQ